MIGAAHVAELVDDDVREHRRRREYETPVEGKGPARRARAPARPLVANRQPAVAEAQPRRLALRRPLEIGSRLLPVPAAQVGDARPRQRHSAEPDDIVALKAEREPASRPRELALEPLAMLRENPLDRGERGAP